MKGRGLGWVGLGEGIVNRRLINEEILLAFMELPEDGSKEQGKGCEQTPRVSLAAVRSSLPG
jgi:hypothetical protein